MSEHSRKHHSRSSDVRYDQYSDDPYYGETQDEYYRETYDDYDYNHSDVSDQDIADHQHLSQDDNLAAHQDTGHAGAGNDTYISRDYTEADFPETEDVWLKEKLNRITYNDQDLLDIERGKNSTIMRTIAGIAGVASFLGLVGFLALSSTPDLSPEEIIAMEGYEGEQRKKTPYNLASFHDCNAGPDCNNTALLESDPTTATRTTGDTTEIVNSSNEGNIVVREIVQEIPATTSTANTVSDSSLTSVPVISSDDFSAVSDSGLVVLQQWSNVRGTPGINGSILTSLAQGTNVTKIGEVGNWVEVETNGRRQVTGYMHRSTVGQL